jgi:hypothetical protein
MELEELVAVGDAEHDERVDEPAETMPDVEGLEDAGLAELEKGEGEGEDADVDEPVKVEDAEIGAVEHSVVVDLVLTLLGDVVEDAADALLLDVPPAVSRAGAAGRAARRGTGA